MKDHEISETAYEIRNIVKEHAKALENAYRNFDLVMEFCRDKRVPFYLRMEYLNRAIADFAKDVENV